MVQSFFVLLLAIINCAALTEAHFDKLSGLTLRQVPVLVLVVAVEEGIEFVVLVELGPVRVNDGGDGLDEFLGLLPIKPVVFVYIVLVPQLVDGLAELSIVVPKVARQGRLVSLEGQLLGSQGLALHFSPWLR